jgi:hypothetical protein
MMFLKNVLQIQILYSWQFNSYLEERQCSLAVKRDEQKRNKRSLPRPGKGDAYLEGFEAGSTEDGLLRSLADRTLSLRPAISLESRALVSKVTKLFFLRHYC